ncbi:putative TetR family transcriptional regulator [Gordonia araii NBRC 100433]|uniref:Putative TetR family transcriptional regulator n=1 Tax=Gordonia araii NBRC 100433 TaxID=1073574 RepID=G7H6U4_9ACTN|nr:TetR family transcriptional regulator [Gordonia araii]NNG95987.1 TetR/AcrR family transcriptional regulator [Gordonia araii NBRC 100433]GAB11569.1 putative TetR family transcriptional regulator [Gordonia araii NBRC 100433]
MTADDSAQVPPGVAEDATSATDQRAAPARRGRPSVRRDLVEREIKANAARLFAERGVAGTTLQDIADATGLTRQAVYHYVENKDVLFAELVSEVAEEPAQLLTAINAASESGPADRLRQMARSLAVHQMANPDRFRLLIRSEADLPAALADTYNTSRRRVLKELISVIDEGIHHGAFRSTNTRTAALGIVGMINWIAWWYKPGDDADAIAGDISEMALRSVVSDSESSGAPSVPRLIGSMRGELDQLERILGSGS